jgi:uncharacterized membrane protein
MRSIQSKRSVWATPAALLALSLVPAIAGTARVAELARGAHITPDNARFFAMPLPVVLHVVSVVIYSMLGAFQFSDALRRRWRGWHRRAGRLLVVCGAVAALSGLWMAQVYPWPAGDGVGVYLERMIFGVGMLWSLGAALIAIGQRDFAAHGRWMIRAYAIGLGAGTQVFTHLPWFIFAHEKPGETARTVMMGAGWMINVCVAEWIIARGRARETRSAASRAAGTPTTVFG